MIEGAVAGSVVGVIVLLLVVLTIIALVILFSVRKYETTCVGTIIQLLLNQITEISIT